MGVLGERSCCFCSEGGRSERVKAGIISGKGPAMVAVSGGGTGFLIHRNLMLTTHATLPSVAVAEAADIQIHGGRVSGRLVPHRFFITSAVLDLTIVGIDVNSPEGDASSLKMGSPPCLELGSLVYLLGYGGGKELAVGEAKVAVATDSLIKLSTPSSWSAGSAGFDFHGHLAFMICDPMKLSSSSSSGERELRMQFGIPIPIIFDWLFQRWEGSLDDVSKPKSTLLRLRSMGQRSDASAPSFTMRRVFKNDAGTSSSSAAAVSTRGPPNEAPRVTAAPPPRKNQPPPQLLDINFPPRRAKPLPVGRMPGKSTASSEGSTEVAQPCAADEDRYSEVQSSSSPPAVFASPGDGCRCSSDGETMYSAETMESRNFPSPRRVGRSRSCMNYQRWSGGAQTSDAAARGGGGDAAGRHSAHSQAQTTPVNGKSRIYDSPTVSWAMKSRGDGGEQRSRPRRMVAQVSPRWMF